MSTITLEVMLLMTGAVLVLTPVLAGRTPLRAVGSAPARRASRIACAAAGLLCVAAGLILSGGEGYGATTGPLRVTVDAELAAGEVSEEVRVFLDGRDVGLLRVDERTPKAILPTTVAKPGRHGYRLESTRQVRGRAPERAGRRGEVVVAGKASLGIFYGPDGKVYLLPLR